MEIPTKKLKSGFEIPVVALGTWGMGGGHKRIERYQDEKRDIAAIQKAVELGMRRFDTAEIYGEGYSEEILGKALKDFERSDMFVATKVYPNHLAYDDVLKATEASLKRLGLDYIDLYLIHAPNHEVPIKETMRAFDQLHDQGMIKHIGVSNFSAESFKEAQRQTKNKIVLNQVHYNLIFREPVVKNLLEFCQDNDVFLEAWRPIQKGKLAKRGIKVLDEVAEKYQKTPGQVALNWLISQRNVVTLFKTSDPKHLEENLGAVGWEMDKSDIEFLMKEFPIQLKRSNAVWLS